MSRFWQWIAGLLALAILMGILPPASTARAQDVEEVVGPVEPNFGEGVDATPFPKAGDIQRVDGTVTCYYTGVSDPNGNASRSSSVGWNPDWGYYDTNPEHVAPDQRSGYLTVPETHRWFGHWAEIWVSAANTGQGDKRFIRVQYPVMERTIIDYDPGTMSWDVRGENLGNPPWGISTRVLFQGGSQNTLLLQYLAVVRCEDTAATPTSTPTATPTSTPTPVHTTTPTNTPTSTPTATPTAIPAPWLELRVSSCTVQDGGSVTVSWDSANATSAQVRADGRLVSSALRGSVYVQLSGVGRHTVRADVTGPGGSTHREIVVNVTAPPPAPTPTPTPNTYGSLQPGESPVCRRDGWLTTIQPQPGFASCPETAAAAQALSPQEQQAVDAVMQLPSCGQLASSVRAQIVREGVCSSPRQLWQASDGREAVKVAFRCGSTGASAAQAASAGVLVQELRGVPWAEVGKVVAAALSAAGLAASTPVLIGVATVAGVGLVVWVVVEASQAPHNPGAWYSAASLREVEDQILLSTAPVTGWQQIVDAWASERWHVGWYIPPYVPVGEDDLVWLVQPRSTTAGDEVGVLSLKHGNQAYAWDLVRERRASDTLAFPGQVSPEEALTEALHQIVEEGTAPPGGYRGAPTGVREGAALPPNHLQPEYHPGGAAASAARLPGYLEFTHQNASGKGCGEGGPCCKDISVKGKIYRLVTMAVKWYDEAGDLVVQSISLALYMGPGYKSPAKGPHSASWLHQQPRQANGNPPQQKLGYFQYGNDVPWDDCPPPGDNIPRDSPSWVPAQ